MFTGVWDAAFRQGSNWERQRLEGHRRRFQAVGDRTDVFRVAVSNYRSHLEKSGLRSPSARQLRPAALSFAVPFCRKLTRLDACFPMDSALRGIRIHVNFLALATDYDGTIAHAGSVDERTVAALRRLAESGRRLILVTGRELKDLLEAFPQAEVFDRIVAENGAVLYCPQTRSKQRLTEPAPQELVSLLRERKVTPLSVGECVVATWHPQECTVLEAIRDLGMERQITFNKGAVMVLPSGVNKASGLLQALNHLELSAHNTVAVGDAQNDLSFMSMCECSVAVANALDAVKEQADLVTAGDHGAGVEELIDRILRDDLESLLDKLGRGRILLGTRQDDQGKSESLSALGSSILVAGPSGTGKSTVVTGILERFAERSYQFCLFDPEGDYEEFTQGISLGGPHHVPEASSIFALLDRMQNPIVNLLGIAIDRRPQFMAEAAAEIAGTSCQERPPSLDSDRRDAPHVSGSLGTGRRDGAASAKRNSGHYRPSPASSPARPTLRRYPARRGRPAGSNYP